jgi:hypothetical protein
MEPSDKAMDLAVSSRQAMNSGIHLITHREDITDKCSRGFVHRAAAFPRGLSCGPSYLGQLCHVLGAFCFCSPERDVTRIPRA